MRARKDRLESMPGMDLLEISCLRWIASSRINKTRLPRIPNNDICKEAEAHCPEKVVLFLKQYQTDMTTAKFKPCEAPTAFISR